MPEQADILVIFGITGDLARKMTFEALYRLERRGDLDCRILGVAHDRWDRDELDTHARKAIEANVSDPDEDAIARLEDRLDYIQGDFGDDELYSRLAKEMGSYEQAVFYLEVPPSFFLDVVQ